MDNNTQELLTSIKDAFINTIQYSRKTSKGEFNSQAFTAGVAADYLVSLLRETRDDFKETLSAFIGTIIRAAVETHESLENITKGLTMSILYVSKSLDQEPLQLVSYFSTYSIEHALRLRANVREAARGLMQGVVVVAQKSNLDRESALAVAAAGIMKSAYLIVGPKAQGIFTRDGVWLNYFLAKDEPHAASAPLVV